MVEARWVALGKLRCCAEGWLLVHAASSAITIKATIQRARTIADSYPISADRQGSTWPRSYIHAEIIDRAEHEPAGTPRTGSGPADDPLLGFGVQAVEALLGGAGVSWTGRLMALPDRAPR